MLRCANELAAFLLPARTSYTSKVLRLRAGHAGLTRHDAIAADQLVGAMLVSAAETLAFYLEVGVEGLRSRGEELPAVVGSRAASFVGADDALLWGFPAEHREEARGFRGFVGRL